jgi:hypothetical protein
MPKSSRKEAAIVLSIGKLITMVGVEGSTTKKGFLSDTKLASLAESSEVAPEMYPARPRPVGYDVLY